MNLMKTNEIYEAGHFDVSRIGSDCAKQKLLGVWLDKRDTQ